jgi:hypothetical protein
MGSPDPRLDITGHLDIRLRRLIQYYKKTDPAPKRLLPLPLALLRATCETIRDNPSATELQRAIADLIQVGFFFLMRCGEYCKVPNAEFHPFCLADVALFCGARRLRILICSRYELTTATAVQLTFTTQKNAVRGEVVGQSTSGDPYFCPVRAIGRRIWQLRRHVAPLTSPLCAYYLTPGSAPRQVKSHHVTQKLRDTARFLPDLNLPILMIHARALRASGATALLAAPHVDSNAAQLLGRWQSDTMIRYLHVRVQAVRNKYAAHMMHDDLY